MKLWKYVMRQIATDQQNAKTSVCAIIIGFVDMATQTQGSGTTSGMAAGEPQLTNLGRPCATDVYGQVLTTIRIMVGEVLRFASGGIALVIFLRTWANDRLDFRSTAKTIWVTMNLVTASGLLGLSSKIIVGIQG